MTPPAIAPLEPHPSANHFDPSHPLEPDEIRRLVQWASRAPTTCNLQHWRLIA